MNYLKRSNRPIPESMREAFSNYGSIGANIDYRGSYNEILSKIHLVLIPKKGGPGRVPLCTIDGPTVPSANDIAIIVEAAKWFLHDERFLEEWLSKL